MDIPKSSSNTSILVVDDEEDFRELLAEIITRLHFQVFTAADGLAALELIKKNEIDIALIDFLMPRMNGLDLLRQIKKLNQDIAVIFITGHGSIESAVNAMKEGAYDYITKPIQFQELENLLIRLVRTRELAQENYNLKKILRQKYQFQNIVASSPAMMKILRTVENAAQNQEPVYIYGEAGTGKEMIAKTIHFNSTRRNGLFIPHDCSVLTEKFLLDEWLGRKASNSKYSWTKKGVFRIADGGTVFLKEIAAISAAAQEVLLQIVKTSQIPYPNKKQNTEIDVRIICASRTPLDDLVEKGTFNADLFKHLNSIPIHIPPLRARKSDIPLLVHHFLKEKDSGQIIDVEPQAMQALQTYRWFENVSELRNIVYRCVSLQKGGSISLDDLPDYIVQTVRKEQTHQTQSLAEVEKEAIFRTLQLCNWNITHTARALQITRSTLHRKIELYQLKREN
jgi:DNA-binding NtrC family response regulator